MTLLKKETKGGSRPPSTPTKKKKKYACKVGVGGLVEKRKKERKKSWWYKRLKEKMALARENSGMQLRYTNLSKNEVSPYSSDISLSQKFILTLHLFTETHRQTHTYTRTQADIYVNEHTSSAYTLHAMKAKKKPNTARLIFKNKC